MGDYIKLHGTVRIKENLVEAFRPRFTYDAKKETVPYNKLSLPEEITLNPAFRTLAREEGRGSAVPGSDGYGIGAFGKSEPNARMTFTEDGVLDFYCSTKITDFNETGAFLALLPLIATNWEVEVDEDDIKNNYDDWGNHRVFRCTDDAVTIQKWIDEFMKKCYILTANYRIPEVNQILEHIVQNCKRVHKTEIHVAFMANMSHVSNQPGKTRRTVATEDLGKLIEDGVLQNLPRGLYLTSKSKRMVLVEDIDFEANRMQVALREAGQGDKRSWLPLDEIDKTFIPNMLKFLAIGEAPVKKLSIVKRK